MKPACEEYQHLRDAYNAAFKRLSTAIHNHCGLEEAEADYHRQRDALCEFLIHEDREWQRGATERLAYSLWIAEGRPAGTAESDWYRAETLLVNPLRVCV